MENVQVVYADLPSTVNGMVVKTFDDGEERYTVVLNSRKTHEQNMETCLHELEHLGYRDFDDVNGNVQEIENARHEK